MNKGEGQGGKKGKRKKNRWKKAFINKEGKKNYREERREGKIRIKMYHVTNSL